jgi:hypothetical protein
VVSHKSEYAVYLKTILELWKRRKQISFWLINYYGNKKYN